MRNAPQLTLISSSTQPQWLDVKRLQPHPQNPRLIERADVIEQIAAGLEASGFDAAHALIVRPLDSGGWQIISGHNRHLAAARARLDKVPCWVRDLDDAAAYMLLLTSNAQGELSALERGMHALNSKIDDVKVYAASVGRAKEYDTVRREKLAAEVATICHVANGDHFRTLVEIHAAPGWLWPALVAAMIEGTWTVEKTRAQVARYKDKELPADAPVWLSDEFTGRLVAGDIPTRDIKRIEELLDRVPAELYAIEQQRAELAGEDAPDTNYGIDELAGQMSTDKATFSSYSEALEYFDQIIGKARRTVAEAQREIEKVRQRSSRRLDYISLEEWRTLDAETKAALLPPDADRVSVRQFNKQESDAIEWAQWSWNPITGCLHDCPYCYARDLALGKAASAYPDGFAPALRPSSLLIPRRMQLTLEAAVDGRYRNVFTGSMADIFGRWVPDEWIEAVLSEIRAAPEWNFLCLTKFPKRMAEFDIPANAWMGTTIDLQARVPNAESGFSKVGAKVRWLSCEPLIEPLRFKHLDRFNWIVIGGASRSSKTPEWRPPFEWISDLVRQARDAGLKIYMKTNLGIEQRIIELPFDPQPPAVTEAPEVFHYLSGEKDAVSQARKKGGKSG